MKPEEGWEEGHCPLHILYHQISGTLADHAYLLHTQVICANLPTTGGEDCTRGHL